LAQDSYDCQMYDFKLKMPLPPVSKNIFCNTANLNDLKLNVLNVNPNVRYVIDTLIYAFVESSLYFSPIKGANLVASLTRNGERLKFNENFFLSYLGFGEFRKDHVNTEFVQNILKKFSAKGLKYNLIYQVKSNNLLDCDLILPPSSGENKFYLTKCLHYYVDKKKSAETNATTSYDSPFFPDIVMDIFQQRNVLSQFSQFQFNVGAIEFEINDLADAHEALILIKSFLVSPLVLSKLYKEQPVIRALQRASNEIDKLI
jgi:hypothetical protein